MNDEGNRSGGFVQPSRSEMDWNLGYQLFYAILSAGDVTASLPLRPMQMMRLLCLRAIREGTGAALFLSRKTSERSDNRRTKWGHAE